MTPQQFATVYLTSCRLHDEVYRFNKPIEECVHEACRHHQQSEEWAMPIIILVGIAGFGRFHQWAESIVQQEEG